MIDSVVKEAKHHIHLLGFHLLHATAFKPAKSRGGPQKYKSNVGNTHHGIEHNPISGHPSNILWG
jgi:hypothetical protein